MALDGALIVQSDKTLLLEVDHERSADARRAIAPFAELERAPEHIHTYRVTPLGLWNARAAGHDAEQVVDALVRFSRYAVPHALLVDVMDTMDRYGRLRLEQDPVHGLVLRYKVEETDDGFTGEEGSFTICSFWLVSALCEIGEYQRARQLCGKLLSFAGPLDLYAEEIDPHSGQHLGNFPQAFTHLALINAVLHVIKLEADHQQIASGAWAGSVDVPDARDVTAGEDLPKP